MGSEDAEATADSAATEEPERTVPKRKTSKTKKSKSSSGDKDEKSTPKKKKNKKKSDVEWENSDDIKSDEDWATEDLGKASPSVWDPKKFDETSPWKDSDGPKRVQDLPSPAVADAPLESKSGGDEEEWPFKERCKIEEKKSKSKKTSKKKDGDSDPAVVKRSSSKDPDLSDASEPSAKKSGASSKEKKKSKKKDTGPSVPARSRRGDTDDEAVDADNFVEKLNDESGSERRKPRKRASRRGSNESGSDSIDSTQDDELAQGSFHKLAKDFDKKPTRSNSKSRSGSASGRRRRGKDKGMDQSGHDEVGSEAHEEFGDEDHEVKLAGDPGSGGAGRMSWRERRAQNRTTRTQNLGEEPQAPGSGGRRPPPSRRGGVRRASSERWRKAVENQSDDDYEIVRQRRTQRIGGEMSRSAHGIRRYHSGDIGMMASSYHSAQRTPHDARRTPSRRNRRTPQNVDSAGSFGEDDYEYDMNLSGRSGRTLDSIEDLEDFTHMDFQTPGMIDYDEDLEDLMHRANPEHTEHLQRRVNRKRDAVHYDQDMPMMTRQALMTRQASAMVMKGRVDGSNIDRRRLMIRNDSMSSAASGDGLDMSGHSGHRRPARRAPPRSKSSGLGAMAMARKGAPDVMAGSERSDPDRRGVFRTKSSTSSFRQTNKPNRVAQISRRAPNSNEQIDPHSMRGASGPRRGSLQRAKSMGAMKAMRSPTGSSPQKPERRRREKEDASDLQSTDEDSDLDSDDGAPSTQKSERRKLKALGSPAKSLRKTANKKDMSVKRNRRKLHAIFYEAKMGIDMKELFKQVKKGDVPRSPVKTLMMPSP